MDDIEAPHENVATDAGALLRSAPGAGAELRLEDGLLGRLSRPDIRLAGQVNDSMHEKFQGQLAALSGAGPFVIAMTTLGGDPEVARAMAADLRLLRAAEDARFIFLGKSAVYSAGVTFMAGFPRAERWLERDTRLMIHERKLEKNVHFSGPLEGCLNMALALVHEIENGVRIEREGFEALISESPLTLDEVIRKAPQNWYLDATEALELKLVAGIV
ncbi:peptidase S14 [Methylocella silvestris]|uniref:Peptidase S14 n=1 Tax=Methylocella silvestris TaxID=199596 RepID=A0A2J7TE62_METSI|nr:peptidase S14 [Methylocella silvestris]PNG25046.1 peptidase S14 [Methylocella silvestris]